jgi:hypothetical protein
VAGAPHLMKPIHHDTRVPHVSLFWRHGRPQKLAPRVAGGPHLMKPIHHDTRVPHVSLFWRHGRPQKLPPHLAGQRKKKSRQLSYSLPIISSPRRIMKRGHPQPPRLSQEKGQIVPRGTIYPRPKIPIVPRGTIGPTPNSRLFHVEHFVLRPSGSRPKLKTPFVPRGTIDLTPNPELFHVEQFTLCSSRTHPHLPKPRLFHVEQFPSSHRSFFEYLCR